MRCSVCGTEVTDGAKFCETCGAPLQASGAPTEPVNAQPIGQQPAAQSYQPQPTQQMPTAAQSYQQQYASGAPAAGAAPMPSAAPSPQGNYGQQKQGSNAPFVLSIIALVTAVIGLFPISLVLAIIALAMNRGQKKRGEQSTKQTPTFVMSLISLILSILVALATLALGGLVWLAVMDDEIDLDHVTESTAPAQAAPADSPVGVWTVVSMTDGDDTYDAEYLKLMENMGITFELVIAQDGTASLEFYGESETGTWEDRGSGKVAITFDGDTVEGTVSGDELTISFDGDDMVLHRSSKAAPATAGDLDSGKDEPKASSSASAASSSSSSSSASSASSAAASADSYSTDEEPTLGDFSWYAGAGVVPSSATELKKFADVKGGWKAYVFGNGMERLCNVSISGKKDSAKLTVDWNYVHDTDTDKGKEDDTPDSKFEGDWESGLGLEVLGAGRIALTDFWEENGHQYGMGSFMWPSGETDTILLVRP